MNPRNFFAELKRRNVYKVAVAYAVVGWLVIQISATVLPTFHTPEWVVQTLVVLVVLGFPLALILAWAFELTPEGIKRAEDVAPNESITPRTGRKLTAVIIVVALIAAVLLMFQFVRPKSAIVTPSSTTPTASVAAAQAIREKSIAVLPFDNLSHDPENAYFAEGVQDEILTRLAKIADLKVISRTSTQRFRSAPGDLRQIAQQLGVANILEGSVQKSPDQVRVNVQLINASTDAHLWADTYDRKLTDIFAVESEIAKSVVEKLKAQLTGSAEHVLASRPTENPEAHQLYLKGRYFWNKRVTANLKKSIDYFQQAIEKDSAYALAYAGLADAYGLLPLYARTLPREDLRKSLAAARKAVELDDSLAEAHTSLANTLGQNMQPAAAMTEFQRAIELNANYATAHQWYGEVLQSQGRFHEAVTELERAHELDPLSVIINDVLGSTLVDDKRYDEGIEQLHKALEMDPTFYLTYWFLGDAFKNAGALPEAIAQYEKASQLDPDPIVLGALGNAYALAGRENDARKVLEKLSALAKQQYVPANALAVIHIALGEKEEGLRLLEKSYADGEPDLVGIAREHRFDPLRGDPRFEALVQKVIGPKAERKQ